MINELRKILEDAPEGATHVSNNGVHYKHNNETPYEPMVYWCRGEEWIDTSIDHLCRSLSDIKLIVSLCDELADQTGGCTQEILEHLK